MGGKEITFLIDILLPFLNSTIIEEIDSELSALHAFKCSITLKKHFRYLTEHFLFPLLLFHYTIYPLLLYTTKHQWCHCASCAEPEQS